MKKIIKKQAKILEIFKKFSKERLEEITEDDFIFENLSDEETLYWSDCVWIAIGKKKATYEEISNGFHEVLTLAILETLSRRKLVFINESGNFERTKLGKALITKILLNEEE